MVQLMILLLGALTVMLIAGNNPKVQLIGFICGFISEPFWFYSSYKAGQWGIFVLAMWFTFWYAKGIWNRVK